jgi:iron complex transport system substrate-binding protein
MDHDSYPRRIASLSDEATELIYLLGEQERIVGVSGFSMRPPEVKSKPKISTFRDADFEAIARLDPDLIITYSDVQAEITRQASLRGFPVLNCNQRSLSEIFDTMSMVARIVGRESRGDELIAGYRAELDRIAGAAAAFPSRPRVFFEEWNDPLISGIEWVEELVEIAGGEPVFPELRGCGKAQQRLVSHDAVIERNPDVIFASWCGMKVKMDEIYARPGWERMTAIRRRQVFEIHSSSILQPGPAALTDGVRQLHAILSCVVSGRPHADVGLDRSLGA